MNEEEKDPEIIPPGKQPLNREHQVGIHVIDFEELKGGETVVEGPRNHSDGMWDYNILVPHNDPLPPITEEEVNSTYNQRTKA